MDSEGKTVVASSFFGDVELSCSSWGIEALRKAGVERNLDSQSHCHLLPGGVPVSFKLA